MKAMSVSLASSVMSRVTPREPPCRPCRVSQSCTEVSQHAAAAWLQVLHWMHLSLSWEVSSESNRLMLRRGLCAASPASPLRARAARPDTHLLEAILLQQALDAAGASQGLCKCCCCCCCCCCRELGSCDPAAGISSLCLCRSSHTCSRPFSPSTFWMLLKVPSGLPGGSTRRVLRSNSHLQPAAAAHGVQAQHLKSWLAAWLAARCSAAAVLQAA